MDAMEADLGQAFRSHPRNSNSRPPRPCTAGGKFSPGPKSCAGNFAVLKHWRNLPGKVWGVGSSRALEIPVHKVHKVHEVIVAVIVTGTVAQAMAVAVCCVLQIWSLCVLHVYCVVWQAFRAYGTLALGIFGSRVAKCSPGESIPSPALGYNGGVGLLGSTSSFKHLVSVQGMAHVGGGKWPSTLMAPMGATLAKVR